MKKIDYRAELKEEYARWKRLFCQGGQDPFWPDGVNLNLIRNHITACRAALEQEDKTVPEEYGWLLPPEVPPDYMARGKEIWYRGMESYKKYTADENYQYLKEVSDTLPEKVKKESSIENVLGKLSDEQFVFMTSGYEEEKKTLKEKIAVLDKQIQAAKEHNSDVKKFVQLVKRYTQIKELTYENVHEFIDRILIYELDRETNTRKIEIFYNFVGKVENTQEPIKNTSYFRQIGTDVDSIVV